MKTKAVFLDRDGVLNIEKGDYVWKLDDFELMPGAVQLIQNLKKEDFLLIVVTNQAGIAKGLYTENEVYACHEKLQNACGNLIDDLYFSPYHPSLTASLSRKPDSLMIEKAIAKYNIDITQSWLIGDRGRDVEAGQKAGLKTIQILSDNEIPRGNFNVEMLIEAEKLILVKN
jgi:D-glycero-D-manno-heptose 1,7-bisphosphate phosphatase